MTHLTIAYANHRPETLPLSQSIMEEHELIILEEPPHQSFYEMLRGTIETEDYLLDQDIEYPAFSRQQCLLMQRLFRDGRKLLQVEPFIERLLEVQNFFADGNGPDDLDQSTVNYQVYLREKEATQTLINYYQTVRGNNFADIIESVDDFARADAKRFELRDRLRAEAIVNRLNDSKSICIEAGPIHLLLCHLLHKRIPSGWTLKPIFVELSGLKQLGISSGLFGPGDKLTVHYLFGRTLPSEIAHLLCARTLIFMKIVNKEEYSDTSTPFPHLADEARAAALVNHLSFEQCRKLFFEIRDQSVNAAIAMVRELAMHEN